ncbi:hypothetical protein LSH36_97g02027 [Paralvinella palmiformis]|uniref:Methyltransferase FkbM domain-containing protein n=1 Tax=Paralvinella palmiformis TaxID=53620 RepID=A0AAD9K156_9ANNE|nr:hypothetical protein LSH36_97g02027 [Paralvinella palmiformis]
MMYNLFLSPLWTQWRHPAGDSANPTPLPWLSNDEHLHVVNTSRSYEAAESTISSCVNTRTEPTFAICIYPINMDVYISKALLSDGVWEPYITPLFVKALRNYPDATVIDIGANIGYYSLLSAAIGRRVVAVEPSIINVGHILKAIRMMGVGPSLITVLHNAVLNSRQKVTLTSNPDNQGGLWVQPIGEREQPGSQPTSDIPNNSSKPIIDAVLMDDLLTFLTPERTVIIKVDIEGFECQAIAGAIKLLHTYYVPYVFMEWGKMFKLRHQVRSACPVTAIKDMTDLFTKLDYVAVEVRTGFVLDSSRSSTKWKIGDVYWRHRTAPEIQRRY